MTRACVLWKRVYPLLWVPTSRVLFDHQKQPISLIFKFACPSPPLLGAIDRYIISSSGSQHDCCAPRPTGKCIMPPQQRTILLVDDDHEIIESMRTVLENKGYRVLVARDGN